jgi:phosphoribosylanthranilate isomerase
MDNGPLTMDNARPLSRPRIKICGVTRPQDAVAAARAGADAIGMVFYPQARRCVTLDLAREILRALPAFVTPVGLFVDQDVDEIRHVAAALHLRHVQLHGHESEDVVAALRDFTVLKAVRAARETLKVELDLWRENIASMELTHLHGFVLETPATGGPGGTGVENDWAAIADLRHAGVFDGLPPIFAAGGLRPENVADVVRRLQPYAVDVSSGVEASLGEKSPEKIERFVAEVARASAP